MEMFEMWKSRVSPGWQHYTLLDAVGSLLDHLPLTFWPLSSLAHNLTLYSIALPWIWRRKFNSKMTSFMDLPLKARNRVYAYLGLFRLCPIEFNRPEVSNPPYEPSSSSVPTECVYIARKFGIYRVESMSPEIPDCQCPKLPLLRLLLVCRAFYHDVFNAFYSRNYFAIRIHDARGFGFFHVGQHIQSTLTSLLVRLNSWPCPRGHEETWSDSLQCTNCQYYARDADPPMDMTSRAGHDLVHWWRWFAKGLGSSISSNQLDLMLICDVTDKASGMAVVKPLLTFPTLKRCTIRLGRQFNYELSQIAEEASLRAQALFIETRKTFPFQRLPAELRLRILSYTHLGNHNSYCEDHHPLTIENNKLVKPFRGTTTCCRKCTPTLIDCCCTSSHAAYSSSCECRQNLFAFLLVSKQMKVEAMQVLLSQNVFSFLQDPIETIRFLENFPKDTLHYIRRIQFGFSEVEVGEWEKSGYRERFTQLVEFIRDNFEVSKLSITVLLKEGSGLVCDSDSESDEDLRFLYETYRDVTQALRQLSALENVQFELDWFIDLEPIMRRAVLGRRLPMGFSKPKCPHPGDYPHSCVRLPTWYKRGDFTRWWTFDGEGGR